MKVQSGESFRDRDVKTLNLWATNARAHRHDQQFALRASEDIRGRSRLSATHPQGFERVELTPVGHEPPLAVSKIGHSMPEVKGAGTR